MFKTFVWVVLIGLISPLQAFALDLGTESMADKADRFDFEDFHKEKGITLWEDPKDKAVEPAQKTDTKTPVKADQSFEKGQTLKAREAYRLGNDPTQRQVQTLFEATEALHKQLNSYCPNDWVKEREWHMPESAFFYMYYEVVCL